MAVLPQAQESSPFVHSFTQHPPTSDVARQAGSAACCPQLPRIDPWHYEGDRPHLLTALLLLYGLSIEQVSSTGKRVLEFICELKHLLESY